MRNQELQKTLTYLQHTQKRLKNKLRKKEVLLKSLKNSWTKFEMESASKINELIIENEKQKNKITSLKWGLSLVSIVLIVFLFLIGFYIYFKIHKR